MNDESALLEAARRFDNKALAVIFDTYAPAIYRYVLRLCHDPVESDNIVGDVFARLIEKFAVGQGPRTNLRSYLFSIAYHLVVDGARHNHRLTSLEVVMDVPSQLKDYSVDTQVDERNLLDVLRFMMNNRLSEVQRHVLILRFMEDFSLQETAAIVDKKVNHVKVIQSRGIAKLRKLLEARFRPDCKKQSET